MKKDRKLTEICLQCGEDYVPTRKGVQKFCSDSCRSRNWLLINHKQILTSKVQPEPSEIITKENIVIEQTPTKIDKISAAGVGNSALGTLIGNAASKLATNAFQRETDKPATKGDLKNLENIVSTRYFEIHNMSPDIYGRKPFFDTGTCKIVYFNEQQNRFELPLMNL